MLRMPGPGNDAAGKGGEGRPLVRAAGFVIIMWGAWQLFGKGIRESLYGEIPGWHYVDSATTTYECEGPQGEPHGMCCQPKDLKYDKQLAPPDGSYAGCTVEFVGYTPGSVERWWLERGAAMKDSRESAQEMCGLINHPEDADSTRMWVADVEEMGVNGRLYRPPSATDRFEAMMSKYSYKARCGDWTHEWDELIEPLHGAARMPGAMIHECCRSTEHCDAELDAELGRNMMDVGYLLLDSARQSTWTLKHEGQRTGTGFNLLFDVGASQFRHSMRWLMCTYRNLRGIRFDKVHAWEGGPMDMRDYHSSLPEAWQRKVNMRHATVTVGAADWHNPVRVLKEVAKPADFVVFKLDIDNTPTELALMEQILDDPKAAALVDEVFFELHFQNKVMAKTWLETGWEDVNYALALFQRARKMGIRMHFWP